MATEPAYGAGYNQGPALQSPYAVAAKGGLTISMMPKIINNMPAALFEAILEGNQLSVSMEENEFTRKEMKSFPPFSRTWKSEATLHRTLTEKHKHKESQIQIELFFSHMNYLLKEKDGFVSQKFEIAFQRRLMNKKEKSK